MTPKEEAAYEQGRRATWRSVLGSAVRELRGEAGVDAAALLVEREDAVAALRIICRDFGDNDWDPSLRLEDVIDKHLGRHLHEMVRVRGLLNKGRSRT